MLYLLIATGDNLGKLGSFDKSSLRYCLNLMRNSSGDKKK